jgi:hypothetical protein
LQGNDGTTRAQERAAFLVEIARDLQSSGVLPKDRIALIESRIAAAVYAYFALNDAYKKWRIEDGHNTQPPKIAALQSLCIIRFSPFKVVHPEDARTVAEARANEIYCVAIMAAILGFDLLELSEERKNQYIRIIDLLNSMEIETIEPVIQDLNYEIKRDFGTYQLAILPSDRPKIEAIITICELLMENAALRGASAPLS